MTLNLPRPPRKITPEAFYCTYLPSVWKTFVANQTLVWPEDASWHVANQVSVDGQHWTLHFDAGDVTAVAGSAAAPALSATCDLEAWRAALRAIFMPALEHVEAHAYDAWTQLRRFIALHPTLPAPAVVQANPGRISIELTDDAGDAYRYDFIVGGGGPRHATLLLKEDDIPALLQGAGNLPRLLQTRLTIQGDAAYVVRLLSGHSA